MVIDWQKRIRASDDVRFVPAHWILTPFALLRLWLEGRIGKLGIAGLLWSLMPRTLKLVTAGLAGAGAIVVAGALAALTLLAIQLT